MNTVTRHSRPKRFVLGTSGSLLLSILAACGGNDGSATGPGSTTPPPTASVISGTAATGAALANANVLITNSAVNSPCNETTIKTDTSGKYSCTLKPGEKAPFAIVVTDPLGNAEPLVSVTTTTPEPGQTTTVNATPLTTAIVAQLLPDALKGKSPANIVGQTVDPNLLKSVTSNVVAQLKSTLDSVGLQNFDPFGTPIDAATASKPGGLSDQLLDIVLVSQGGDGGWTLSVAGTTVSVATPTSGGDALPAVGQDQLDLAQAPQKLASQFAACFALPTAQRGTADTTVAKSDGGATVTRLANGCSFADSSFAHRGYTFGQYFYPWLTSDAMTGATFTVSNVAVYPAEGNAPERAAINIAYVDANGAPGNLFNELRYIGNKWLLTGDQNTVDVNAYVRVDQNMQMNQVYANALGSSNFRSRFAANVNTTGPGSKDASGGTMAYAIAKGPGLPPNGLVYVRPRIDQADAVGAMDVSIVNPDQTTGVKPIIAALSAGVDLPRCGVSGTITVTYAGTPYTVYGCSQTPYFSLYRTQSITGAGAAHVVPFAPSITNVTNIGNVVSANWFDPSAIQTANQHGQEFISATSQPGDGIDITKVVKGAAYTMEIHYYSGGMGVPGTETSVKTVTTRLLADIPQAAQAANLTWNTLGDETKALFAPTGPMTGELSNFTVDWVPALGAEPITSIWTNTPTEGYTLSTGPAVTPQPGATSIALNFSTISSGQFTAWQGLTGQSSETSAKYPRELYLNYRTTNGIVKRTIPTWSN